MANENYLIAVASSDGIVVNNHFGRAGSFYIYEVNDDESIDFFEKREVTPICDGGNHSEERLKENLLIFQDCRYLLVSRIGSGAADMAQQIWHRVLE